MQPTLSAIETHQVLEEVTRTPCENCNLIHCLSIGDNTRNSLLRIVCHHCLQPVINIPRNKLIAEDPDSRREYCPYGRLVVVAVQPHGPGDHGYRECMVRRRVRERFERHSQRRR